MQPVTNNTMPASLNELDLFISKEYGYLNDETENATWAVYSRLSRVDPNNYGYSLEIQPDRAEEYARSHGAAKIEVYSDPDRTGRNSRRKELQRMMNDIRAGRVQIVVVHRLDRLYRNLESLLKFVRFLKQYQVRLVSVTEQIDTDNIMGRFMLVMLGMMAETYVHQTSERTREAKVHRARSGLPNGYIPLGYCNGLCATCNDVHGEGYCPLFGKEDRTESQRGRVAVPHPVTKHAIPLIFDLYLQGHSYREIADWLNSNDFTLPDGQTVRFKTKGQTASNPESLFSRESIRAIMENPFFAGVVARYERPELDMEDDPENPEKRVRKWKRINSRQMIEIQPGQHEALISVDVWKDAERIRKMKSRSPITASGKRRIYALTGVSRCWDCYDHNGSIVTLRGSTTGNGKRAYRCSNLQDRHRVKRRRTKSSDTRMMGITFEPNQVSQGLIDRHQMLNLPSEKLEATVDELLGRLEITEKVKESILAYYLSDEGISAFERENFNLRQSMNRFRNLYQQGDIGKAEYEEQKQFIEQRLKALKPSSRASAQDALTLLINLPAELSKITSGEKRLLLNVIFKGLYFDSQGNLRKILAHPPFDKLLGLENL